MPCQRRTRQACHDGHHTQQQESGQEAGSKRGDRAHARGVRSDVGRAQSLTPKVVSGTGEHLRCRSAGAHRTLKGVNERPPTRLPY